MVNKIDLPEVRDALPSLVTRLRAASGHTRVMGVSAATRENVPELMRRVRKLVDGLPKQSDYELFTEEENRVSFDDQVSDDFDILRDDRYPNQFRIVGRKIEKVCLLFAVIP